MHATEQAYGEAKVIERRVDRLSHLLPHGALRDEAAQIRARLAALAARIEQPPVGSDPDRGRAGVLRAGPIEVDIARHQVLVDGEPIAASRLEFQFIALLAGDPERVFSKAEIGSAVWGMDISRMRTRTIDSHASRIRRKLRDAGCAVAMVNHWGLGYALLPSAPAVAEAHQGGLIAA